MSRTNGLRVVHKQGSHPSYKVLDKGVWQIMFIYQPHAIANSILIFVRNIQGCLRVQINYPSKGGKGVGCDFICLMNISHVNDLVEI